MNDYRRHDNRAVDELRKIQIEVGIAPYAPGSVLVSYGRTKVICAATIEKRTTSWTQNQVKKQGWINAEYSMLPYSTVNRKSRTSLKDGRSIEIQRLIGRSLRAVADLDNLLGHTMWIDCDVLQADGGTRTAAITGGYIAARLAVSQFIQKGILIKNPFRDAVAAISVGLIDNHRVIDLDCIEDNRAMVDFNVVMTGLGSFIEIQGAGEGCTFSDQQLHEMLSLARQGIATLSTIQQQVISQEILKLTIHTSKTY